MTGGTEKLPPNLKGLADMIAETQAEAGADPVLSDLMGELDELGKGMERAGITFRPPQPGQPGKNPGDAAKAVSGVFRIVPRPGGGGGGKKVKCPNCDHVFSAP